MVLNLTDIKLPRCSLCNKYDIIARYQINDYETGISINLCKKHLDLLRELFGEF